MDGSFTDLYFSQSIGQKLNPGEIKTIAFLMCFLKVLSKFKFQPLREVQSG